MASTLRDLLIQKRASVINRWIDLIFDTYPPEAGKFMRSKKDRIANPVGATIVEGADRLFDWLVGEEQSDEKQLTTCLDDIVRIRAVQEFSASHAVGFVFLLKTAIKEVLGAEMRTHHLVEQFLEFERKIDDLALLAFDNYARCREQLHRIRVMEVKNRTSRLLERAVQKYGVPSDW